MKNPFRTSHLPYIALLSLVFGTGLVASRFGIGQMHALVFVALRVPLATLLALVWTLLRYRRLPRGRTIWLHGAVVGVFATAAPMVFFITALQYQSSGVTALFITLTPIAAMIYAHFLLPDDRMTARKVIGAVVSFAGVGLLLATGETGLGQTRWEGFVLVLIGVASNGFGIVHVRKHLSGQRTLDITSVRLLVATVITVPLAALTVGFDLSNIQFSGGLALLYGVFGALFGFLIYSLVASRFGPTKATQTEYLVPVVTVITGAVFLDERVTWIVIAGMVLAIAGIVMATAGSRSRSPGAPS